MIVYIYNNGLEDYEGFYFSFDKKDLIKKLKSEYSFINDFNELVDAIEEHDIKFPECSWIITNYNEWEATYTLERYIPSTDMLKYIEFYEYDYPELHVISETGYIDNEPFIFIQ